MSVRSDRIVLAVEVLLGVLPITIVGGGYSILGLVSGIVSILLAVREHAVHVFTLWLAILALSGSGLIGIVALWIVVGLSATRRPAQPSTIRFALIGSVVGALAAGLLLGLIFLGSAHRRPMVAYILLAPILVVLHRRPSLKTRGIRHTTPDSSPT